MIKNLFNNLGKIAISVCIAAIFATKIVSQVPHVGDIVKIESVAKPGNFLADDGAGKATLGNVGNVEWILQRANEDGNEIKSGTFPKLMNKATGKYLTGAGAPLIMATGDYGSGEFWTPVDVTLNNPANIDLILNTFRAVRYPEQYTYVLYKGMGGNGDGKGLNVNGISIPAIPTIKTEISYDQKVAFVSNGGSILNVIPSAVGTISNNTSNMWYLRLVSSPIMPTKENPTVSEDAKITPNISYGDVVRLTTYPDEKIENGITLHSHRINYNTNTSKSTSGQQQVTGYTGEDNNDWWLVASPENKTGIVKSGDKIALIHLTTKKSLHTHTNVVNDTNDWDNKFKAPDNEHREITCYNLDKKNIGNIWIVKVYEGKAPAADGSNWTANKNVVLERYNPNLGNPDYKTNYAEYLWISDKTFSVSGPQDMQHIVGLNKIPTYFVVEDIKNKPNYIYGKFVVDVPVNLPSKWFAEDGKFSIIAVGSTSKGEILKYGIDMDGNLYIFNNDSMSNNPWEKFESLNDTAKQSIGKLINLTISVDGNMLVINSDNKIFKFDFTKKVWSEIKRSNQPKLIQISCGNDKTIVAKSAENKLYKLGEKEWEEISDEGEMVVATVKSNIFGLGLNGKVYKHITDEDWKELATEETPFIYIAAADTVEQNVKTTDTTKKNSTKTTTKTTTTSKTTDTVEKTVIFGIDKNFAFWKLEVGETKWTPILGKDGKQATGFSRITTNGVSHAALDGENDNYHFGESGIKIASDKTTVVVTPVKTTRTKAIETGKVASKVVTKKTVKTKSTVKKAKSKTKLTTSKKTTAKSKKSAKKTLAAKKKAVKKTSAKTSAKKTSAKTVTPAETSTATTKTTK